MTDTTPENNSHESNKKYFKQLSLGACLALPLFVQVGLVFALILATPISDITGVSAARQPLLLGLIAFFTTLASAYAAQKVTQQSTAPNSFLARFAPALAPLILMWLAWMILMHQGIQAPNKGAASHLAWIFAPYVALGFYAVLSKPQWFILIPSLASLAFLFFVWQAYRHQPLQHRHGVIVTPILIILMAGVISWQLWNEQRDLVSPFNSGERVAEGLEVRQYEPFSANNKLVNITPAPTLQFSAADAPRLDGATAAYPVYAAIAQAMYPRDKVSEMVKVGTTPKAYEALINGQTDAIFVAQASKEQARIAKEKGVQLNFTPVGKEAFVFVVNASNPVASLTLKQVQDIYAGRVTSWHEVGGSRAAIQPFQRPANSGSQTIMEAKVMQGQPMRKPMQEEIQQGMGGLVRQVAAFRNSENALGYSFRFYVTKMLGQGGVKLVHIDGIEPSLENIRSGKYPLSVDVFMVTTQHSKASVNQLRDWVLSPAGQKLIQDTGYVSR